MQAMEALQHELNELHMRRRPHLSGGADSRVANVSIENEKPIDGFENRQL
jgi:hypothetical protein